jgi:hypothetical protein
VEEIKSKQQMSSTDTPLRSVEKMVKQQQKNQSAYVVLSATGNIM